MQSIIWGIGRMFWMAGVILQPFYWLVDWLGFWKKYVEQKWVYPFLRAWTPLWIKPDYFSYLRIILVVPICYLIFVERDFFNGSILYLSACATDYLDGALARARSECSVFGERLDPLADKILNCGIFVCFIIYVFENSPDFKSILGLNIGIDVLTTILALVLLFWKGRCKKANSYGKTKMVFQCAAVMLLFVQSINYAYYSLYASAIFGVGSLAGYIRRS